MLHGAAEPQAPMADSKLRTLGCGSPQRCRRRVRREQGGKAPEHGAVVSRSKPGRQRRGQHAKQIQGPWGRTVQQQPPGDLKVRESWELLEEDTVLRRGGVELRSDVVIRTEGSSQDSETLLVEGQVAIADPCSSVARVGRQVGTEGPGRIPNTSFGFIEADLCMGQQVTLAAGAGARCAPAER